MNSMQACKRWDAMSGAIRWLLAGRWICLMLLLRACSTPSMTSLTLCACALPALRVLAEFGANIISEKYLVLGRIAADGEGMA